MPRQRPVTLALSGGPPTVPRAGHRSWPEITEADHAALSAVLTRGELWGLHGLEVTALQEEYSAYSGAKHCLAVNSGTAALHCALVASDVQPGSEVIVPAFSFVATAMAVIHAGATPVFCDIDPRTYNIDPAQIPPLITERTAAIMPVHMHGLIADMQALVSVANRYSLALIEDAAQAHGATSYGQKAGTFGNSAAFSLNGAKNLSAGEGGLFVCHDDASYKAARRLAIFGEDTPSYGPNETRAFWSRSVGWNYRIHEITAALARAQLKRLDGYNATARRNASILSRGLAELPGIEPPYVPPGLESVYCRYRIRCNPATFGWEGDPAEFRDRLLSALRAEGVAADAWQRRPLPAQPVFRRSRYYAWSPNTKEPALAPWEPSRYPEASRLLDESIALCPDRQALYVQETALMRLYVDAFEKVIEQIDAVMTCDYEPVRDAPPIPADDL